MASVIGRVFPRQVLAQAAGQAASLTAALWRLEERALIYQERTTPEEEYSFKHVLTQETIYRHIPPRRRRALHQQVAEALETIYAGSLDTHYEQLAHHYDQSGQVDKAINYLLLSGQKAMRNSASEVTIAHFSRGLTLLATLPEAPERTRQELALQIGLGSLWF